MAFALLFLFASALVNLSRAGNLYTSPAQVVKEYDFIIVGAGTAGCVLAARLSEVPTVNVLVIEAGGSDNATSVFDTIYAPLLAGTGSNTIIDWNYSSIAQTNLDGRVLDYPRGRVLGGSSAINGMIYSRGAGDEYNRLASVSGDPGWGWSQLKQYVLNNEKHSPPWNGRSNAGEYNPAWHGTGPLLTGLTPQPFEFDNRVLENTQNFPSTYPFNLDFNSGNGLGYGWLETSVGNGMRSTSASTYLHPVLSTRTNLDVLINTQVLRLTQTSTKTFRSVLVSQVPPSSLATSRGRLFTASKEVILAAGSIGTPQLLLLSGVGPTADLSSLGIPTVLDVPDVGQNLQDQTILALQWEVNSSIPTLTQFLNNESAIYAALEQWEVDRTGPGAGNMVVNTVAFDRLPATSPLLNNGDPAAGSRAPHFLFAFMNFFYPNPGQTSPTTGNWNSVCVMLVSPTSRGSLSLTSSSPFAHPRIDPAFYSTDFDMGTTVAAIRKLQGFLGTSSFDGYLGPAYSETATALASDTALEAYIRKYTDSIKHPTSTARISKTTDSTGVVGPDLLVKGLTGLRIVDASILPSSPAGFPQAEIYIIAERASDLIKQAWNLA